MAATSHDVARLAGVSQPTVSRALRGAPGVSEATRQRILAVVDDLAYVPSETGRSLSTRATRRIGIVAADMTNPFYPELVEPLREGLEKAGYRSLLVTDRVEEPVEVNRLADGSLDAVVLTTTVLGASLPAQLRARGIPFVTVNRETTGREFDACVADNRRGAARVADLLCQLGHQRIGAIFGPSDTSTGRDREAGFRRRLGRLGVSLPAELVRRGTFSYQTGYRGLADLFQLSAPPTAVFCGNDVIAVGASNAGLALGLRFPDDVSVVGFDDIAMASWEVFDLTTVRCGLATMASAAVDLLLRRISAPDAANERVVLPTSLVLRGTHGARTS